MTWAEFKKFSGILTFVSTLLALAFSAFAYSATRNDVENTDVKEAGALKAIVEEHGKSLARIENKIDTLLMQKATK